MITSLRLIDFRCFEAVALDLEHRCVFFTGANAQGKTSLLEAIAVASRLGSPRASRQSQIVREGKDGSGVAIQTEQGLFKAVYQDRKFELSQDGAPCKKKDYLENSPRIVWMENRDLELIRGTGERRRRFLDTIGAQMSPLYARSLRDYTKALRSRNALLKDGRSHDGNFQAFTELVVRHGEFLITTRQKIIHDLLPYIEESHHTIAASKETFSISYRPSSLNLAQDLEEGLERDRLMKQTLIGAHRDDFSVLVDNRVASDFASEGQQRTLAIALRLAQGRLLESQPHSEVVYLVDDVFGELDEQRRQALMQAFPKTAQTILTTTQIHWGEVDAQVFELKDGKIV